jgi:hypothetical protein
MGSIIRRVVVAVLLAAWSFPAAAATRTENVGPVPAQVAATNGRVVDLQTATTAAEQYAAREKQAQGVQDFQGGEGYVYIGGGVLTAALLILLILILV